MHIFLFTDAIANTLAYLYDTKIKVNKVQAEDITKDNIAEIMKFRWINCTWWFWYTWS